MYIYHSIVLDTESVRRILKGEQTAIGQAIPRRRYSAGKPGDILWVKERWRYAADIENLGLKPLTAAEVYAADIENLGLKPLTAAEVYYFADDAFTPDIRWRNAVTMPFNVSRLHLKIESVKLCAYSKLTPEEIQRLGREPFTRKLRVAYTEFSVYRVLDGGCHVVKSIPV